MFHTYIPTGKPSRSKIPVKNAAQGGKTQGPQDVKLVNDTDTSAADGAVLQRFATHCHLPL